MALSSASSASATFAPPALAAFAAGPAFLAPANLQASRQQHQKQQQQRQQEGWWSSSSSPSRPPTFSARRPCAAGAARGRFGGFLRMAAAAEGGAETESSATAEVPEATKRLLEQAAKIRAEVRCLITC